MERERGGEWAQCPGAEGVRGCLIGCCAGVVARDARGSS